MHLIAHDFGRAFDSPQMPGMHRDNAWNCIAVRAHKVLGGTKPNTATYLCTIAFIANITQASCWHDRNIESLIVTGIRCAFSFRVYRVAAHVALILACYCCLSCSWTMAPQTRMVLIGVDASGR